MPARTARAVLSCLLVAAAPAASAIGFAGLEQLIADRNVRSIEDLLPLLPGDLRSRYVLMFRSRSLHGSSFAHPRAILFTPEARFVISFNGDAGQAGFNALETMEFDDADKSFRFREIVFPSFASGASAPDASKGGPSEARSAKEGVRVSPPNPERCLKCHGEPARPIWDTHPMWPGAYGERFDATLTESERSGLQQFLREQPSHPRYRTLLETGRFANLETFRPSARTRYEGDERLPPNGELGAALGRLNFESIVHQLESRPQFDAYQYVLLAALGTDCGRLDAFYSDAGRAGIRDALDRFVAASARANAAQARSKQLRAIGAGRPDAGGYGPVGDIESLDRFRFVVETGFGLSTNQWTTALEKGSYDFAWSPSAAAEMAAHLRKRVARTDPQTKALADFRSFSGRDPYCAYLARRSRVALQTARPEAATAGGRAPASGAARTQALLDQCAGCHLDGVGPQLPFNRPRELAALLRGGRFPHGTLMDEIRWRLAPQAGAGRMPPGTNISDEERDALLEYFAALSPSP
jgi:mono/diheme cytochrome c family protein